MPGINNVFIQYVQYKFQPGNCKFEVTDSLTGIVEYVQALGSGSEGGAGVLQNLKQGYQHIADYEEKISAPLLDYLMQKPAVRIIGEKSTHQHKRVPTISFVHDQMSSKDIVTQMDAHGIGIRYGDFYAVELIDGLGLREKEGVVRVSLVHYNTLEEVDRLIEAFESIL